MSARLRVNESKTKGARRIVRNELKRAAKGLDTWPIPDESVHDARKRLKKSRAALRLIRLALPSRVFRCENSALRDAARPLSRIRDAKVLIDAYDGIVRPLSVARRQTLFPMRELLVADHVRARARLLRNQKSLKPLLGVLRSARRRTQQWPAGPRGWSAVRPGFRRVYRSGRAAFEAVLERPTDGRLHEWRKQAKYLWLQLEMLAPMRPRMLERMAKRAHTLSDRLGDDHDLAVLRQRIVRARVRVSASSRARMLKLVDDRRRRLQGQAMRIGHAVYAKRPRAFVQQLAQRSAPTSR